ncbi:MAG: YkgJ family cysteine cluster protein [Candidatus Heimdallarchaeota archaeon]|nr:YkgJ family cysteine cluster protein [Candidatus Heimdallarchaeota archaeon]MCK4953782.1 YkgJ family cysteine cluster protein [Candidatus Heimdallarchaeota archaeon]
MDKKVSGTEICSIHCGSKCCKSTRPALTSRDIERINNFTDLKNWFIKIGINSDKAYVISKKENSNDCIFLSEKNLCVIYENRPFDCRLFPLFIQIKEENETTFVAKWLVWYCPLTDAKGIEKLRIESKSHVENILSKSMEEIFEYQKAMVLSNGYKKKHFLMEERLKMIKED